MEQKQNLYNQTRIAEIQASKVRGSFGSKAMLFMILASTLLVITIYVWFISAGRWIIWRPTSSYYSQLALSFEDGQLSLEIKPDPALLSLSNPYDPKERKGIPFPSDTSLYDHKFYLYFGPLPAIVLAIFKRIISMKIGDQYLVFVFIAGIFIAETLLLIAILRRFFANIPTWVVTINVLSLGLTGPFTRMLTHPFIHEAAITGGQFFFIVGWYFVFSGLYEQPVSNWKLLMAGVFWAFSISTRVMQIIPIGFMLVMTTIYLNKEGMKLKPFSMHWYPLLGLTFPLLLCSVLLAWYNWARFGSIFEFGMYYQLAGFNMQSFYHDLFSRAYLFQNFYNYYLNPFQIRNVFPYAYPVSGIEKPLFSFYETPKSYVAEGTITGFLLSTPSLLFVIVPLLYVLKNYSKTKLDENHSFLKWTITSLMGTFLFASAPIMLFFFAAYRYETDFIPALSILSAIGFCQGYTATQQNKVIRRALSILGISLVTFSVLLTTVLAYTGHLTWFGKR